MRSSGTSKWLFRRITRLETLLIISVSFWASDRSTLIILLSWCWSRAETTAEISGEELPPSQRGMFKLRVQRLFIRRAVGTFSRTYDSHYGIGGVKRAPHQILHLRLNWLGIHLITTCVQEESRIPMDWNNIKFHLEINIIFNRHYSPAAIVRVKTKARSSTVCILNVTKVRYKVRKPTFTGIPQKLDKIAISSITFDKRSPIASHRLTHRWWIVRLLSRQKLKPLGHRFSHVPRVSFVFLSRWNIVVYGLVDCQINQRQWSCIASAGTPLPSTSSVSIAAAFAWQTNCI